jgi:hypothetical protein
MFVIKRGWGSKWLLATSLTVVLSILVIVLSLGAQDNSFLFMGLGTTIIGGIGFYFWLKVSPISSALIGNPQHVQSDFSSLSEDEKNRRKQSAKLAIRDIIFRGFVHNIPIIIGIAIILLFRNSIATSLGLFVMGFTGIFRIVLRPKHISPELYFTKSKMIGNVLITLFAWSLAVYGLFNRWSRFSTNNAAQHSVHRTAGSRRVFWSWF